MLEAYHPALARLPHPETLGPLMVAAALAAHGMVDRARRALDRAVRGEAWEAALEHRWFVETLMEAFDGDRSRAVERAESLEKLPLPAGNAPLQKASSRCALRSRRWRAPSRAAPSGVTPSCWRGRFRQQPARALGHALRRDRRVSWSAVSARAPSCSWPARRSGPPTRRFAPFKKS